MNLIRENGKEDCGNIKLIGSQVYQALYVRPTTQIFWKSMVLVVFYNVSQEKDQVQGFPFNVNAFPILSATFDWIFGNLVSTSFIFIQTLHFDSWNWHQNLAVKSFYLLLRWQVFHQRINARSTIRFESGRKYRAGISLWSLPTIREKKSNNI